MIEALLNFDYLFYIILAIIICVIIVACIKYPSAKYFVSTILITVFLAFTVFCGINLYYYVSAYGGIYGAIEGIINPNTITYKYDELTLEINNIMLTKEAGSERYMAICTSEEYFEFDNDMDYVLLINDTPCLISEFGTNYIMADYVYEFLNEEKDALFKDTLSLRFSFDKKITTLKLYTYGGSEAVKFWNCYFLRNGMSIKLNKVEKSDYVFSSNYIKVNVLSSLAPVYTGGESKYFCNTYIIEKNSTLENVIETVEYEDYEFVGYSLTCDFNDLINLSETKFNTNSVLYCMYNPIVNYTINIVNGDPYFDESTQYVTGTMLSYENFHVLECNRPESYNFNETYTDTVYFLSIDNCGEISQDEYSEHSAFALYHQMIGSGVTERQVFVVEDNYTFYVGSYTKVCNCSTSSGGSILL